MDGDVSEFTELLSEQRFFEQSNCLMKRLQAI